MNSYGINPSEVKVALLCGGKSGERQISLASGEGSSAALREAGFDVTVLDPAKKDDLITLINGEFDIAFLCLHGRYGEDGAIQGLLELLDLPYTGSGIWSSATAIHKGRAKHMYDEAGLPTPRSIEVHQGDPFDTEMIRAEIGQHLVVKAACEGSTLGIFMVREGDDLESAINEALSYGDSVVVESFVQGSEFTVVVIGNEEPRALPVIQIIPANEYYDFESKYAPGGSQHVCPAEISDELTSTMQNLAVKAHQALMCSGVSRTDFIVDSEGACWILETNTLPGMTATSLLPDAASAAGISFPEICTELIALALDRFK